MKPTQPSKVPYDLVPGVLRHLHPVDDYFTLCACAIVCVDWKDIAQRRLFYQFFLIGQPAPHHFSLCLQFIENHPHLWRHIRCLVFRQFRRGRPAELLTATSSILTMSDILAATRLVPSLRELHIQSTRFIGDDAERILIPSGTALYIDSVQCVAPRTQPLSLLSLNARWGHVTIADILWYPGVVVKHPPILCAKDVTFRFPSTIRESKAFSSHLPHLDDVKSLAIEECGHWLLDDIDRMLHECATTLISLRVVMNSTQEGTQPVQSTYLDLHLYSGSRRLVEHSSS